MGVQFPTEKFGPLGPLLSGLERLLRLWLWGYFKIFHRTQWKGVHLIPRSGACVIAANHTSFYDPALIGIPIMRRMRFMAYHTFFAIPGIGSLMRFVGAFPVDNTKADRSAYQNFLRVLRDDQDLLIIFPEGGRTRSGALNVPKPGTARMALTAGAAIVPAVALGPEISWPHHRSVPRLFVPMNVKYYPPIRMERPATRAGQEEIIAEINRQIEARWRRRIRALRRLRTRQGKASRYAA